MRNLIPLMLATFAQASVVPTLEPGPYEPGVVSAVATLLGYQHYEHELINDEISRKWLDRYVDTLDPSHMVFLEEDLASFASYAHALDDDVLSGAPRLHAATEIYGVYVSRLEDRVAAALAVLDSPIDLTDDEELLLDRSDAPWPVTDGEADALWRKRIEEQVLQAELRESDREETLERLRKRYDRLVREVRQTESLDVLELYLSALAEVYDPHSAYFKPATNDNFDIQISNSVEGIGAALRNEDGYTIVSEIIPGGPAAEDGSLHPGDKIIAVAQGKADPVDVVEMRLDSVVHLIRGRKGTEVRLTIIPGDATDPSETRIIPLVRDKVVIENAHAKAELYDLPRGSETLKIGVIDLPSFYVQASASDARGSADDVKELLVKLQEQDVDGVVLDLRNNGGGGLDEAVRLSGLFLKHGPMVQIRDQLGRVQALDDPDPTVVYDGPLVVLTNPLSASAAEIVAGALQDYGRAVVVGSETTHGKGTVQTVIGLRDMVRRLTRTRVKEDLGALKLTTQKFYRASGSSTQLKGVESDVVLPSRYDGYEIAEGDHDNALVWDEIPPAPYQPYGDLTDVIDTLRTRSAQRVEDNDDLKALAAASTERVNARAAGVLSLNLETRKAELEERLKRLGIEEDPIDGDLPAEEEATTTEEEDDTPPEPSAVLREAMEIVADLSTL